MRVKRKRALPAAILAAAALICLAAALLLGGPERRGYEEYMSEAADRYKAGDYDGALSYLRRAEEMQHSDDCLVFMADCYEAQGNLEKAVEILRQLDTSDSAIAQRITSMERRRLRLEGAGKVTVAGRQFNPDTGDLTLDSAGVTDGELPELGRFDALERLSLRDNGLRDISGLSELKNLYVLDLSYNGIEDLGPLSSLSGLGTLILDGNPLSDLSPVSSLRGLNMLSVVDVNLSDGQIDELSAALPGCAIRSGSSGGEQKLTISGVRFTADAERLDLSGLGLVDLGALSGCTRLKRLDISGNRLSDLGPLTALPCLEELDFSENQVSDLRPLIGIGALQKVDASYNQISDTSAVAEMGALTALNLSGNPLEGDLSALAGCKSLRTLELMNTGLEDGGLESLKKMDSLLRLCLDDNPELSGEAVDALERTLRGCNVSHSPLVYTVEVNGASVRGDETELRLPSAGVSDLDWLSKLYRLETLDLSGNGISNIYMFSYSPSRFTIKNLDLSDNELEDATPLAQMGKLEQLDLKNNKLVSLQPLMQLKNLRVLDLRGNALDETELENLRLSLPDCAVLVGPAE